jgi:hypothetical protein
VSWPGLSIGTFAQVSFVVSTCQSSVTNAYYGVSSSAPAVREQGASLQTPLATPSLVVSFTYSAGALVGSRVYLTGTTSTNGGPIVAWSWNLGDGTTASGPVVSHSYAGAGPFNVTLTVTDTCGHQKSVNRSVTAGGALPGLSQLRVGPVVTQTSGVGFTLVITAQDAAGNVLTNYGGLATLVDSSGTLVPTSFSNWSSGVATVQAIIRVMQPFNGDVITVTSSSISGSSNRFNVVLDARGMVLLVANPTAVAVGRSTFLTATVLGSSGQPVSNGTLVTFTATLGKVAPQVAATVGGKAYAVFTGTTAGTAVLTATLASGALGNATVQVSQSWYVYAPNVMNNYRSGKNLQPISIVATPTNLAATSVTLRNAGDVAVTEPFWVVLYVDPTIPVQPNKFWWEVGSTKGIAWRVTTPIPAGQTLTLTASGSYVDAARTAWPPARGTRALWVQVDAYGGPAGLVQETNESDNIYGPVTVNVP